MLSKEKIERLKEHLNKAQNPVFFFDNDPDGLCSFLLLQRNYQKGKGVPIKSSPDLSKDYFRKVLEFNSDYIFILDKPLVSKEFFEESAKRNCPIIWIDHHIENPVIPDFVEYYNPLKEDLPTNEPVTAISYQITQNKKDIWIAIMGCISDRFCPDFFDEFKKEYPDLTIESNDPSKNYYLSQIGRITKMLEFGLKDKTTNVIKMIKYLLKIKSPYEILEENKENATIYKRYNEISKKYQKILEKAKNQKSDKIIFFKYSGNLSISSELASELQFLYPEKLVIVAYIDHLKRKVNISGRGQKIREILLEALEGLQDASGGGHESAVGAKIRVEDLKKFEKRVMKIVSF